VYQSESCRCPADGERELEEERKKVKKEERKKVKKEEKERKRKEEKKKEKKEREGENTKLYKAKQTNKMYTFCFLTFLTISRILRV